MKRKLVVVTLVFLVLSVIAGAVSPSIELWWVNRGVDPGLLAIRRLRDLYKVDRFEQVLTEARKVEQEGRCGNYGPQILYLQWVTNRRLDRDKDAAAVQSEFLRLYPDHLLAADMHFADAMQLLATSDYPAAEAELAMIEAKYPDAKVTAKAKAIRQRLAQATTQPTRPRGT